jgi:hypothetical protein
MVILPAADIELELHCASTLMPVAVYNSPEIRNRDHL